MESAEDVALAKTVGEKVSARAPDALCPFCRNKKWYVIGDKELFPVIMLEDLRNFSTYTFACTNCGFIRQHLRDVVEGKISGEVEYAQPGGIAGDQTTSSGFLVGHSLELELLPVAGRPMIQEWKPGSRV